MLSDDRINELKKIKDQGNEASRLLDKYWNLKNEIAELEHKKSVCHTCNSISFNNGYTNDFKISNDNLETAAKTMKVLLQMEIDTKQKELEKLNDLDDFVL
jgi:hypothetical protein